MNVKVKKIAAFSVLLALSLILSYIESLAFGGLFMPGVKLGLSNIAVVAALYGFGFFPALLLGVMKSILSLLIFGRLSGLFYSLAGIIFAVLVMAAVKKTRAFSLFGVGVCGSAAHIAGQLAAACVMLTSVSPLSLFPLLCALSIVSAAVLYFPEKAVISLLGRSLSLE